LLILSETLPLSFLVHILAVARHVMDLKIKVEFLFKNIPPESAFVKAEQRTPTDTQLYMIRAMCTITIGKAL
jgi:hypothetical protein